MLISCSKCKEEKPATAEFFPKNKAKKNGFDSWCRACYIDRKRIERRGKYRSMISDAALKDIVLNVHFCTICGDTGKLNVDHDHKKNVVRGLLCNRCNFGLGHFRDDPQLLEFARIYLLSAQDDVEAFEYLKPKDNCHAD